MQVKSIKRSYNADPFMVQAKKKKKKTGDTEAH